MTRIPSSSAEFQDFLASLSLFAGLQPESLRIMSQSARVVRLGKGDYLFFQDEPAEYAYIVLTGWIVIGLISHDGRELVFTEMRRGDLFGENALIAGMTRSASAMARDVSALLELPQSAFLAVLDAEPHLVRALLDVSVTRLCEANQREGALAFLDAKARVARILRTMDELDRRTADRGYITLSQEELAQRTGLTRQTVARILGRWRRDNWLITGRGRVMLLNRPAILQVEQASQT